MVESALVLSTWLRATYWTGVPFRSSRDVCYAVSFSKTRKDTLGFSR